MVDVGYGQAATGSTVPVDTSGLGRCQQFCGSERAGRCQDDRAYDAPERHHYSQHQHFPSLEPSITQRMSNCVRRQYTSDYCRLAAPVKPLLLVALPVTWLLE